MNKLEKAKRIIEEYYDEARLGIYNCRNTVGDRMDTICEDDNLQIDICYPWAYFEVYGLSENEFKELEKFYGSCGRRMTNDRT